MRDQVTRIGVTSRIVRPGEATPPERDWLNATIEERIEAVWELTKLCYAWNQDGSDELEFQKTVVRIQRPGR